MFQRYQGHVKRNDFQRISSLAARFDRMKKSSVEILREEGI